MAALVGLAAALFGGAVETQDAAANGDTRTLSMVHQHTGESLTVTFKRDGRYDAAALEQLNWFLRDWREREATKMDPRLFDTVWEAQRQVGATQPLRIVCGYRSPRTNGMLRARSSGVAEHSQHMLGKAMDFFMPDASVDALREAGIRLQRGGVGWYPRSGSPFVHLDVGSVRAWPRMSRAQLARIFPDGKTVHLPADGKPLARYAEARAEILARGGTVLGHTALAQAEPGEGGGISGFFAGLFGGAAETAAPITTRPPVALASAEPGDATGARQALAFAAPAAGDALREATARRASARDLLTGQASESASARPTPLPPRRPAAFAALAGVIAPMPPGRPVALAAADGAIPGMALGAVPTPEPEPVPEPEAPIRSLFRPVPQGVAEPARRDAPVRLAAARPSPDAAPAALVFAAEGPVTTRFSPLSPGDTLAAARFSAARL